MRKILRSTFLHTSQSHSAAPGMHAYSARENPSGYVCFAAVYFAFSFVVVKPIQSKQVELSVLHLASYLCLHHTRLYYCSTYCTHENCFYDNFVKTYH